MGKRKMPVLEPQYMKRFKCTGTQCEDSCCMGWGLDIDKGSYDKYISIEHEELSPMFDRYIIVNDKVTSDQRYAKVLLNDKAACPFLSEKMLCRIQCIMGEEYLSNVCAAYPRVLNVVDGMLEVSGIMSCPEVAKLALLNKVGIEFDEELQMMDMRDIPIKKLDICDSQFADKPHKYFWKLRIFTITVLQNRNYALWERLVLLGLFYYKCKDLILNKKVDELQGLIEKYTEMVQDNSFKEELSGIPKQYTVQMRLLKEIADERICRGALSGRYIECFMEFMEGLGYTQELSAEEIEKRYYEAHQLFYEPFMKDHHYILENYLVSYVFEKLFPIKNNMYLVDDYMEMVLHYSLIKMHLIGMAAHHKGLTVEMVLKLIQCFTRAVDHSPQYLNNVKELMKNNGYDSLAYMAILIRN